MKRMLSLLLLLAFLLISIPSAMAEVPDAATLVTTESSITTMVKYKVDAAALIRMSDGTPAPTDLKFKLKNTKYATVNKKGIVTGKKAGSVTLTASSKRLGQSVTLDITVIANVFNNPRSVEQVFQGLADEFYNGDALNYHAVFCSTRKAYFKNGKLTIDLHFYNRFGYSATKIFGLDIELFDAATGTMLSRYKKKTVRAKKLADGASFKFTFSFPTKGLDKKYDLTKIGPNGFMEQLDLDIIGFSFVHNAPVDDPWGYWDDDEDDFSDYSYNIMSTRFKALKRNRSSASGTATR